MSKLNIAWLAAGLVTFAALAFVGCSSKPAASDKAATEASAAMPDGFDKLSEADRAAALAQKICPVSGEKLGDMGTPIKVTVKGRDVFLCCPSCKEDLLKDPDKYFAKLDAK